MYKDNPAFERFRGNGPASGDAVQAAESQCSISLPDDYFRFLLEMNGGEGFIGPSAYVILWRAENLAEMNRAYEVNEYAPGLFLIGSDGGGEAFAFDTRRATEVVSVPFVGMDLGLAEVVGASFTEFVKRIDRTAMNAMSSEGQGVNARGEDSFGKEIFEIHPVILGGSPTDPANKVILSRREHIEAVRYWNGIIRQIRPSDVAEKNHTT